MMANSDVRQETKHHNVRMWQLADYLGVSEATVTRLLRHELPEEDKTRLLMAINAIAGQNVEQTQPVA